MTTTNPLLSGVRVLDLSRLLPGPFCSLYLAQLGADVVKIEEPGGGDYARESKELFAQVNRGKKSITLDLREAADVAKFKELVATADVVLESFRPGVMDRLGCGYDELKKIRPDVIYAYALGYKRSGPYGHKPAFDDLVQGASGAASLPSRVDGGPPRFMPSLIADKTTGLHLAMAVLAALFHRQRTGQGQMIEVPMFETLVSFPEA